MAHSYDPCPQPFDTVKVRLQTHDLGVAMEGMRPLEHPRAMACAAGIVSKEGVTALFKGMVPPLATAALVNAVTFSAYAQCKREMESTERRSLLGGSSEMWKDFVSGSFAGLCQSPVVIPTDNIKVKLQVQVGAAGSPHLRYKGMMDCAAQLVRTHGIRSLLNGTPATLWRDVPSFGVYFAVYEWAKDAMERRWSIGRDMSSMCAGGFAGGLTWFIVYPFDVVKTVQQASESQLPSGARSMSACFRTLFQEAGGGLRGCQRLFRGVGTTVARAVPVNAVIFLTYEWSVELMQRFM
ncbi:unnamed protein product [Discosporangium mesarthrocarpum]